jgi:hypothetical protein
VGLDVTGGVDDVHGAAGESDDDSGMIVVMLIRAEYNERLLTI